MIVHLVSTKTEAGGRWARVFALGRGRPLLPSLLGPLYGKLGLVAKDEVPFISVSRAFFALASALSTVRKLQVALHGDRAKLADLIYTKKKKREEKKNKEQSQKDTHPSFDSPAVATTPRGSCTKHIAC